MKIHFIEVCGFRGIREKLRVEFGAGFTVISGRNGVGKSTLCDAIEFAITGEIDKYRVEKAAKETLNDYLWWRGQGTPASHYVSAGFLDLDGNPFTITRTRETGSNVSPEKIEALLCSDSAKPDEALRQICRTSIIRDEWIAALSLDLTETERFELVRAALGAIEGPDYTTRAKEVLSAAETLRSKADAEYEDVRTKLNNSLTELAEMRDVAARAGDVGAALAVLIKEVPSSSGDLTQQIGFARSELTRRRVRLGVMGRAVEESRLLSTERAEIASAAFQDTKIEVIKSVASLEIEHERAAAALADARRKLTAEEEANSVSAALAALIEHGEYIGLNGGRCPLCDAVRTGSQFEEGLRRARAHLASLGTRAAEVRQEFTNAEQRAQAAATQLQQGKSRLVEITNREEALRAREAAQAEVFRTNGLRLDLVNYPDTLEHELLAERSRLIDLERSILILESSQAIDRVTDMEGRVNAVRQNLNDAADRLTKAQAAVVVARAMEKAARRASAEIIDERLAAISPLLNELYQRLRPHRDWRSIEYSIRGDVRRFLSLKVGDNLNPQFVFSSGQRRAAGIAFLLSVHLSRPWCRWETLILDDPVQHIDDFRALHLVEVLAALRHTNRQIICAVEDAALADLLCRRLVSTPTASGRRLDLDVGISGAVEVVRIADIPPMPVGVLRQASGVTAAE